MKLCHVTWVSNRFSRLPKCWNVTKIVTKNLKQHWHYKSPPTTRESDWNAGNGFKACFYCQLNFNAEICVESLLSGWSCQLLSASSSRYDAKFQFEKQLEVSLKLPSEKWRSSTYFPKTVEWMRSLTFAVLILYLHKSIHSKNHSEVLFQKNKWGKKSLEIWQQKSRANKKVQHGHGLWVEVERTEIESHQAITFQKWCHVWKHFAQFFPKTGQSRCKVVTFWNVLQPFPAKLMLGGENQILSCHILSLWETLWGGRSHFVTIVTVSRRTHCHELLRGEKEGVTFCRFLQTFYFDMWSGWGRQKWNEHVTCPSETFGNLCLWFLYRTTLAVSCGVTFSAAFLGDFFWETASRICFFSLRFNCSTHQLITKPVSTEMWPSTFVQTNYCPKQLLLLQKTSLMKINQSFCGLICESNFI